jgi:hypothetical protein
MLKTMLFGNFAAQGLFGPRANTRHFKKFQAGFSPCPKRDFELLGQVLLDFSSITDWIEILVIHGQVTFDVEAIQTFGIFEGQERGFDGLAEAFGQVFTHGGRAVRNRLGSPDGANVVRLQNTFVNSGLHTLIVAGPNLNRTSSHRQDRVWRSAPLV